MPVTQEAATAETRKYGRAVGVLTLSLGSAGVLTYAFFALASHNLDRVEYGEIVVLWSAVFISVSTLFRPVEQLLSRSIAEHEAHGLATRRPRRVAGAIQLGLAVTFAAVALALRGPLQDDLLSGDRTLYWVLIAAVVAFGASFFARGFLAGSRRFAAYATLLLIEATGRFAFVFAVAIGVASGQGVVALGVAAAPILSLIAVPVALRARQSGSPGSARLRSQSPARGAPGPGAPRAESAIVAEGAASPVPEFTLAHGGGFAAAVLLIMLSEQVFMNAGPLLVRASLGAAEAGFIFNVLMVARAPLVLFQAVAASLLPHLTRLRSRGGATSEQAFAHSVRLTLVTIAAFAAFTAIVVFAAGPQLMQLAFGEKFEYERADLLIVTLAMGLYLSAATLNQAALAQGQARRAAACWGVCAAGFIVWNLLPVLDEFKRVETGLAGGAALLCALLYVLYRSPRARPGDKVEPGSPEELELRLAAADETA